MLLHVVFYFLYFVTEMIIVWRWNIFLKLFFIHEIATGKLHVHVQYNSIEYSAVQCNTV